MLSIEPVAEGRIINFRILLPNSHGNHRQPNRSDDNDFRQVENNEAPIVLPEAVVDAQPEHEQRAEKARLKHGVQCAGKPRVHDKAERKQRVCSASPLKIWTRELWSAGYRCTGSALALKLPSTSARVTNALQSTSSCRGKTISKKEFKFKLILSNIFCLVTVTTKAQKRNTNLNHISSRVNEGL